MKGTRAACIVALILLPSSLLAAPRGAGMSGPASHSFNFGPAFKGKGIAAHHHHFRHDHFRRARFYGGYYAPYYYPNYYPYDDGPLYTEVVPPPEPPRVPCQLSTQVVTVPSESGGTREITITRCGTAAPLNSR